MTKYLQGEDALSSLHSEEGKNNMEFSSFKTGSTYTVKALGTSDLISFYSYGIFRVVNSFVAASPSKKLRNGYPVDNLTPWDRAYLYHKELSKDFTDQHGQEASKYRAKQRFAMGFYDVDTGEPIIIDVSKKQAQILHVALKENESKLHRLTFKLSKQGTGTNTTVSLKPYVDVEMTDKMREAGIPIEDDLTEVQRKHFDNAPESFDMSLFDGLLYEAEEDEQIRLLNQAGFDVSLIGLEVPKGDGEEGEARPVDNGEITDDDLPF